MPPIQLTEEQRAAIDSIHGPVRILAGAGTGKTTVVTERIANQVRSGDFRENSILAVTFTRAAADEMRHRLNAQGLEVAFADTFHGTARWVLTKWWPSWKGGEPPFHLEHIIWLLRQLPGVEDEKTAHDVKADIELLKRSRLAPGDLLHPSDDLTVRTRLTHERLVPIYEAYEQAKLSRNLMDYQDILSSCIDLLLEHEAATSWFRESFQAFTVDEYQDLDPLQERLLRVWATGTDDVCVVGDPHQSIFGFAGASNRYLDEFSSWQPDVKTFRLTENFRSTSQVLRLANRLAGSMSEHSVPLSSSSTGPDAELRGFPTTQDEATWIASRIAPLVQEEGVAPTEIAILYRWPGASTAYESALAAAGIPHEVIGDPSFLGRRHVKEWIRSASLAEDWEAAIEVAHSAGSEAIGVDDLLPDDVALDRARDAFALEDLLRACMQDDSTNEPTDLEAWLETKLGVDTPGVRLMTFHKAKGREFDAVFIAKAEQRTLPAFFSRDEAEERRVLYVGLTRARQHLFVSWSNRKGRSPFIADLTGLD